METKNTIQDKLQAIINTIQSLDIKAEYDTMNKLLGCLQLLSAMKTESKDWIILHHEDDETNESNRETEPVKYEEMAAEE